MIVLILAVISFICILSGALKPTLEQWLNTHPTQAQAVVHRIIQAANARQASRSAAAAVRRKSAVSHRLNLPETTAGNSPIRTRPCGL